LPFEHGHLFCFSCAHCVLVYRFRELRCYGVAILDVKVLRKDVQQLSRRLFG
jgi:hypothetical protein